MHVTRNKQLGYYDTFQVKKKKQTNKKKQKTQTNQPTNTPTIHQHFTLFNSVNTEFCSPVESVLGKTKAIYYIERSVLLSWAYKDGI